MNLSEVQALFHQLVTAPRAVGPTLDDLGLPRERVEAEFNGDAALDAIGRLDVYAEAYFFRIRDVLAEQFPELHAAMGEDPFHNLVVDYLIAHPPRSVSLRDVGDRLPSFLEGEHAAIAAVEWARIEVFDEADEEALTVEAVRARPPEELPSLPLRRIAASRVAAGRLVLRKDGRVRDRELVAVETEALAILDQGATFADLCERLPLPEDEVAPAASGFLLRWLQDGLLRG